MTAPSITERIEALLSVDVTEYEATVDREATVLKRELRNGTFDNPQALVGIEFELYAVDSRTYELRRVPRWLLSYIGFSKELGLHNAELHTNPNPLNQFGLTAQLDELQARLQAARAPNAAEDIQLVSDGLWTIPPAGETAAGYLTDAVDIDGVRVATNMSKSVRYHAFSNAGYSPRMRLSAPNVTLSAETPMAESLITSIQPHYQVPIAEDLPDYFGYALRIAGPLLALGVNSPFFPPDLYDDVAPEVILDDAWMEHRILVFESTLNPGRGPEKVRFPRDIDTVEDAVDRIADDPVVVPKRFETSARFDDAFRHFKHKHGTYWRWVRPVFEGKTRRQANARIEFRPLPAQPTVPDAVSFQAAFAGLLESFHRRDHPVELLDWKSAEANFYEAARRGLDADLIWIDGNGERRENRTAIFDELFEHARDGLRLRGFPDATIDRFLDPLRARYERGTTPARWKLERVRRHLDGGASFESAVTSMQREYIDRQSETFIEGSFVDWI